MAKHGTVGKAIPIPGIEPGSPGWKPGVLTVILHRNWENHLKRHIPHTWMYFKEKYDGRGLNPRSLACEANVLTTRRPSLRIARLLNEASICYCVLNVAFLLSATLWRNGSASDSGSEGCGFDPHQRCFFSNFAALYVCVLVFSAWWHGEIVQWQNIRLWLWIPGSDSRFPLFFSFASAMPMG